MYRLLVLQVPLKVKGDSAHCSTAHEVKVLRMRDDAYGTKFFETLKLGKELIQKMMFSGSITLRSFRL